MELTILPSTSDPRARGALLRSIQPYPPSILTGEKNNRLVFSATPRHHHQQHRHVSQWSRWSPSPSTGWRQAAHYAGHPRGFPPRWLQGQFVSHSYFDIIILKSVAEEDTSVRRTRPQAAQSSARCWCWLKDNAAGYVRCWLKLDVGQKMWQLQQFYLQQDQQESINTGGTKAKVQLWDDQHKC